MSYLLHPTRLSVAGNAAKSQAFLAGALAPLRIAELTFHPRPVGVLTGLFLRHSAALTCNQPLQFIQTPEHRSDCWRITLCSDNQAHLDA